MPLFYESAHFLRPPSALVRATFHPSNAFLAHFDKYRLVQSNAGVRLLCNNCVRVFVCAGLRVGMNRTKRTHSNRFSAYLRGKRFASHIQFLCVAVKYHKINKCNPKCEMRRIVELFSSPIHCVCAAHDFRFTVSFFCFALNVAAHCPLALSYRLCHSCRFGRLNYM